MADSQKPETIAGEELDAARGAGSGKAVKHVPAKRIDAASPDLIKDDATRISGGASPNGI